MMYGAASVPGNLSAITVTFERHRLDKRKSARLAHRPRIMKSEASEALRRSIWRLKPRDEALR